MKKANIATLGLTLLILFTGCSYFRKNNSNTSDLNIFRLKTKCYFSSPQVFIVDGGSDNYNGAFFGEPITGGTDIVDATVRALNEDTGDELTLSYNSSSGPRGYYEFGGSGITHNAGQHLKLKITHHGITTEGGPTETPDTSVTLTTPNSSASVSSPNLLVTWTSSTVNYPATHVIVNLRNFGSNAFKWAVVPLNQDSHTFTGVTLGSTVVHIFAVNIMSFSNADDAVGYVSSTGSSAANLVTVY